MTTKIIVSFHIESTFDPDLIFKHFNPNTITKNLKVIPIYYQKYDPDFSGNIITKIPSNNYTASWIYRIADIVNEEEDECFDFVLKRLLTETISSLFTVEKKKFIRKIMNDYDACCYLRISCFDLGDYITRINIPKEVMRNLAETNAEVEVCSHSKNIDHYKAYKEQKLYQF
ncbi:DUF4279 domain-containing protein [Evansella sp. AB-rgal1]|uniref:DUF4279 domain-containing protein n=1 Tax=Evansella sp. AB-rgal1 TaxID=3242696 RepID=UPI00359D80DE